MSAPSERTIEGSFDRVGAQLLEEANADPRICGRATVEIEARKVTAELTFSVRNCDAPPDSSPAPGGGSGGDSTRLALIVGIAVAAVVLLLILVLVVLRVRRSRESRHGSIGTTVSNDSFNGSSLAGVHGTHDLNASGALIGQYGQPDRDISTGYQSATGDAGAPGVPKPDGNLYDSTPIDPSLESHPSASSFEVPTLAHEALRCPHCDTLYATQHDLQTHMQRRH